MKAKSFRTSDDQTLITKMEKLRQGEESASKTVIEIGESSSSSRLIFQISDIPAGIWYCKQENVEKEYIFHSLAVNRISKVLISESLKVNKTYFVSNPDACKAKKNLLLLRAEYGCM